MSLQFATAPARSVTPRKLKGTAIVIGFLAIGPTRIHAQSPDVSAGAALSKLLRGRHQHFGAVPSALWLLCCYPTRYGKSSNRSCLFHRRDRRVDVRAFPIAPV